MFASNQLRLLLAALGYVLIERLRALALQGTALPNAQVDALRIRLLKVAAVITRNTRRIRLYLASSWPGASIFAQAMSVLRPTRTSYSRVARAMTENRPRGPREGVIRSRRHTITASQRQTTLQPAQKPHRSRRNNCKKPHLPIQLGYGEECGLTPANCG